MRTDQDWFHPKIIEDQLMQQINILKEKTEKRNTNDRVLHKIKFYSKHMQCTWRYIRSRLHIMFTVGQSREGFG